MAASDSVCLENDSVKVEFDAKHAEMTSFMFHGTDLLFSGEEGSDVWRGKAMHLFPAVGRQKDGEYLVEGAKRAMGLHGFAMELDFSVVSVAKDSILFAAESEGYGDSYPFGFGLEVGYLLREEELEVRYFVRSLRVPEGASFMPFSIGNHVTFRVKDWSQARVRCREGSVVEMALGAGSLLTGEEIAIEDIHTSGGIPLDRISDTVLRPSHPDAGRDESIQVLLDEHTLLTLTQKGNADATPMLGRHWVFWGSSKESFICPEPWMGAPDSLNTAIGRVDLPVGKTFTYTFTIKPSKI